MNSVFSRYTDADVVDLIADYPLALLVSDGPQDFAARPLPMLADTDESGRLVRLVGHMARSNPQMEVLRATPRCCFLFQGPHGYISPRFVPDRNWGPTWNYALLRVYADIVWRPDLTDAALERLVTKMESGQPNAWSAGELGDRYAQLAQHVEAFEAHVVHVDPRFKLGQDERLEVLQSILQKADNPELVAWMRRMNRHRLPG